MDTAEFSGTDTSLTEDKGFGLRQHGAITAEDEEHWNAMRHLPIDASHPYDQSIISAGVALTVLVEAVELINPLFR